jgi:hypothetical protein
MSLRYHIYGNDGADGPVDYTAPIGDTASLSFTVAVAAPSDTTFSVRTYDDVTGYESAATDARVRVIVDALGADITGRPASPSGLSASPGAGGTADVRWSYSPTADLAPTSFRVWIVAGAGPIDYTDPPDAITPYLSGTSSYSVTLSGLTDGATYTVGVRAYSATTLLDDGNIATATLVGDTTGPDAPDLFTITATTLD